MTYKEILNYYWGYDNFRGIQRQIIESVGSGRDTLGLMPTGGGKSIAFQVPALAVDGVCIVVTPLISLMKDQVEQLRRRAILAAAIHSGMMRSEILQTMENCVLGNTKFLYIAPERIDTDIFLSKIQRINVNLIVVDEAHCISQWGHDFRPSYLKISKLRQLKPDVPILALTATATDRVVEDIQESLAFRERNVLKMSFERENLAYLADETENKEAALLKVLRQVDGSAIVYTRSRRATKEIAEKLIENGISATFYHAGLNHAVRNARQQQWIDGRTRVIVATNAFGMGIDKPDVRAVVHWQSPDSIEAYFQEAGRAGRDGLPAWAVLLHSAHDDGIIRQQLTRQFPPREVIADIYEHLAYFFAVALGFGQFTDHEFDLDLFCRTYRYFSVTVHAALRLLEQAGYIEYDEDPDARAQVKVLLRRDELYAIANLAPVEEKVLNALLRNYGGLFADYVFIDELTVAQFAGLDQNTVYNALKALNHSHIIHFVPRRNIPRITYLRARVEPTEIVIPPTIYEDRIRQLKANAEAVIAYANNSRECRSIQLLRYFGETDGRPCRHCDVCLKNNKSAETSQTAEALAAVKKFLADGRPRPLAALDSLRFRRTVVEQALRRLNEEERIVIEAGKIRLLK